ncbi:MAG TPA: diacylglycerol kinase family protein [Chloroflexota bacterium]|nr:diacylglycerol kinase family protein [Chloroflexota bacterium]
MSGPEPQPRDAAGPPGSSPDPPLASHRSALLILNPRSGFRAHSRAVERVVEAAAALGWRLDVAETVAVGDATLLAADAARSGQPIVLAGGGDGTLNEVIQALAGTNTAVGAVPLGTVNVWARELGLSLDPAEATRQLLRGQVRRLDLGRVNGRYFLLMAGLGFDAVAVHAVEGTPQKRRFGALAFFAAGALEAFRTRGQRLRLRADGRTFETNAALVTIGNTRLWGGAVMITHRASAADGLLDVCIFPGRSLLTKLRHFFLVVIGRHDDDPEVTYLQVRELLVASRPVVPIQVDGDPSGTTPARIEVVPGAVRMLVGPGTAPTLLDAPAEDLTITPPDQQA